MENGKCIAFYASCIHCWFLLLIKQTNESNFIPKPLDNQLAWTSFPVVWHRIQDKEYREAGRLGNMQWNHGVRAKRKCEIMGWMDAF